MCVASIGKRAIQRCRYVAGTALSLQLRIVFSLAIAITACSTCTDWQAAAAGNGNIDTEEVPAFAGTVLPIGHLSSCPRIIPRDVRNPAPEWSQDLNDYLLIACWVGTLKGEPFFIDVYLSSSHGGGGIGVQHGKSFVGWLETPGPPRIFRFTGEYLCDAEHAGAYYKAINVRNGERMDDQKAQDICPVHPSDHLGDTESYVLGLNQKYSNPPYELQGTNADAQAADFAGTASLIEPLSSCPQTIRRKMRVSSSKDRTLVYILTACWQGELEHQPFFINEYIARDHSVGGIAVLHGRSLVGWLATPTQPLLVRFTGEYLCNMEQLGTHYEAININTGNRMEERKAQQLCPISWNPVEDPNVRGLKTRHKIRYDWVVLSTLH